MTTIALLFQYLLSPMALTIDATHDGPLSQLHCSPGWSESSPSGVIHETAGSVPLEMFLKILVLGHTTLVPHSLLCRTALIASKPSQMPAEPPFTITE